MDLTRGQSRLGWIIALFTVMAMVATLSPPRIGGAADHLDAPGLTSPGGNAQADINDLYAFEGADPDATVLAMTVVPAAPADASFGSNVLYELKVDTDADFIEDLTYEMTFSDVRGDGSQFVVVQKAEGDAAADGAANGAVVAFGLVGKELTVVGGGTFFAGLRSDPFFFDLDAFLNVVEEGDTDGRQFNDADKSDFFAPLDALGIVLEVPDSTFGGAINVWATTSVDGTQIDRIGRPAINTVVNSSGAVVNAPDGNKDLYNSTEPKDDAAYRDFVIDALIALSAGDTEGSYTEEEAGDLADILLPDVLPFDKDGTLPPPLNGRALADDVISTELNIVTGGDPLDMFAGRDADGAITTQGLDAHSDYLDVFPYLGTPHSATSALPEAASVFQAKLSGSQEVPSVSTEARGVATFRDGSLFHVEVVRDLEDVVAAHIHLGDPGENGPVVAFLYGPDDPKDVNGYLAQGEITGADQIAGSEQDLLDALTGGFAYVNVHTTANPGGEIRGQIGALDVAASGSRFTDTAGSVHESNIEVIAAAGITRGCNPPDNDEYCTTSDITRGQMAAFVVRALNLAPSSVDAFDDDDDSIFENDINALAATGITRGTSATTYSPNDPMTRGQMAAFLVRAFGLPASADDAFEDDDDSIFENDINALAASGITVGTSDTTYSPLEPVTRAQMATFMARALGLGN